MKVFVSLSNSDVVYAVELADTKYQEVLGVSRLLDYDDYAKEDSFLFGRYANIPDDFDMSKEKVEWMEDQFCNGFARVVSRGELLR